LVIVRPAIAVKIARLNTQANPTGQGAFGRNPHHSLMAGAIKAHICPNDRKAEPDPSAESFPESRVTAR
jgi:hypothetical protein